MDVVTAVQRARMGVRQYLVVLGGMLCNLIDGYDLSILGFAMPRVPDEFASQAVKGWLVSTGLIGMSVGAILLAPFADRVGRRKLLIGGVALNLVAIAGTGLAPDAGVMFVTRFCTGVGCGIVAPLSIVLVQEYVPSTKRNLTAGFVTIGFAIGAALGGIIGLSLVNAFGGAWQLFFWAGAVLTAVVLAFIIALMPESLSFLAMQRTPDSRARIARIAQRLRLVDVDPLAEPPTAARVPTGPDHDRAALLDRQYRTRSLLLWIGYAVLTAAYYFVVTWTPELIAHRSGSTDTGTSAGTLITVGGVAGAILFGLAGMRLLATKIAWVSLSVALIAQVVFALSPDGAASWTAATILGITAFSAMTAFVSAAPQMYPVQLRGRGLGYTYGISRVGSVVTPVVAGYVIGHTTAQTMYLSASLLFATAGACALALWLHTRNGLTEPGPAARKPARAVV